MSETVVHPALSYRQGVILVVIAGVCWSTIGLGIRLIEVANVWQILFYRSLALAPYLLLVITVRSRGNPLSVIRKTGPAGVVGGLALVCAFAGGIYAVQSTTVANAMFLFASAPFITALLGWIILRESVRKATWVAMAVAMAGISVMVWGGISVGRMNGNLAALFSALGFAVFTIALRWRKLEDMMPTVFLGGIFAIIVSGVVCYAAGYSFVIPTQRHADCVHHGRVSSWRGSDRLHHWLAICSSGGTRTAIHVRGRAGPNLGVDCARRNGGILHATGRRGVAGRNRRQRTVGAAAQADAEPVDPGG